MQASDNIGWGRPGGGWLWGNMAEAAGKPFSPSGARLAHVLWIHYLSKVRQHTPIYFGCRLQTHAKR